MNYKIQSGSERESEGAPAPAHTPTLPFLQFFHSLYRFPVCFHDADSKAAAGC